MTRFSPVFVALAALLLVLGCETPAAVSTPTQTPSASLPPGPTPLPTPPPYRYTLLYGEFLGPRRAWVVRAVSLNGGLPRTLTTVAWEHDGRFAIAPQGTTLAILDKLDHHLEHTTTWRLRLLDLASRKERDVIAERTDPELLVPWDVGYSPGGKLLLASRPTLDVVDETNGQRSTIFRFPEGNIGVTFRDLAHPTIAVTQTVDSYTIYDVHDDGAAKVADRPLVGVGSYARRPGTNEILEVVTHFDGRTTFALIAPTGTREFEIKGPTVEGLVDLIGTTPSFAYLMWPIAKSDQLAHGVEGSALIFSLGYDGALEPVAGVRNWGPFGPEGVSPDGRALVVPNGDTAQSDARFTMSICCERRPPSPLLDYGDYFVIGWVPEP